jgi:hypothetical protein
LSKYTIDIETNNLLSNMLDFTSLPYKLNTEAKLYCVVIRNIDTDEVSFAVGSEVTTEWLKTTLADATEIILHNGIKFDLIALKLFGVLDYEVGYLEREDKLFGKPVKIVDTLVRSRLLNPDRYGGHGLKAWGIALGEHKGDYTDFSHYTEEMLEYCKQDTKVTSLIYKTLSDEYNSYEGWWKAEKLENKLADLAVKRETYGFWFNKELAIQCLEDLTEKMTELENKVNPILPPKPMNKTNLKKFTPPAIQFKKDRSFSANFLKFVEKHNGVLGEDYVEFYGEKFSIPVDRPIKLYETANISDLDHVKMHLISLGWRPTEWKVRDLTKDPKKQSLTYEKRVETLDRWLNQTFDENKYKELRLEELGLGWDKAALRRKLVDQLRDDKPVRVPTSPCVRVGVEKELCPNLVKLGAKVDFANDFTLFLTYKHRKSSIAGGDLEDVDYEDEYPNTGFLSMYRTVDGRIPTPAIEIGASTNRYRHIGVCNVARASSIYGKEMRSLFGCGQGMYQFGFDFSSLEARIQGHYILPFNGEELAEQLLASKPNDIHTLNANKLGISRDQAKSISYALMYGASYKKLKSMLGLSDSEAKALYDAYWEAVKPLSDLREEVGKVWKRRGSKYVVGIDGRKINTRSQHSLLNALFQSGGVINAKYTTVFLFEWLEDRGYKCDPFVYQDLDCCGMIEYHDECQLAVKPELVELKKFETEEDYKNFLSNWNGKQLGSETTLRSGKICIAMPSVISEAVQYGIDQAEKHTNLKVALGFEYVVANNWYNCH